MKRADSPSIGWAVCSARTFRLAIAQMTCVRTVFVSLSGMRDEIDVRIGFAHGTVHVATITPIAYLAMFLFDSSFHTLAMHVTNLVIEELGEMCRWN